MVFLVDGDVLRSLHAHGARPRGRSALRELPLSADLPGPVAFRSGQPLLLRNLAQMAERFPSLAEVYDTEPACCTSRRSSSATTAWGLLSLTFPPGGQLDEETQTRFVRALADALAQALERAQAIERGRGRQPSGWPSSPTPRRPDGQPGLRADASRPSPRCSSPGWPTGARSSCSRTAS